MKLLLLFSFLSFVSMSCNKSPVNKGAFFNPTIDIHYIDKNGNDLFKNDNNGYIKENVRTYTLVNREKSLDSGFDVANPNKVVYTPYKWGNVYNQDEDDTVYVAVFVLPVTKIDYKNEHYFTTLIDLKEGVEDTMQVYVNSRKGIDSLWYNRQLLYVNPYFPEVYLMQKIITIKKEN